MNNNKNTLKLNNKLAMALAPIIAFFSNKANFRVSFVTYAALNMVPFINGLLLSRVVMILFGVWTLYIVYRDIRNEGIAYYFNTSRVLIAITLAVCAISIFVNGKSTMVENLVRLAFTSICFFALLTNTSSLKENLKEINLLSKIITYISFSMSFISMLMFAFLYSVTITVRDGSFNLGFVENRLFGVFSSPNVGSSYLIIGLVFTVIYLLDLHSKKRKFTYFIIPYLNIFFTSLYLSIGQSRGSYLSLFVFLLCFLVLAKNVIFTKFNMFNDILFRVVIAGLVLVCFNLFLSGSRYLLARLPDALGTSNMAISQVETAAQYNFEAKNGGQTILAIRNSSDKHFMNGTQSLFDVPFINTEKGNTKKVDFDRIEEGRDDIDITNKRKQIWMGSLHTLDTTRDYLIGKGESLPSTPELDNYEAIGSITREDRVFLDYSHGNLHNGYLQLLVEGGILSLVPFILFILVTVFAVLRRIKLIRKLNFNYNIILSLMVAFIGYVLANNIMETNMFLMGTNYIQVVLWLFIGYVLNMLRLIDEVA